MYLIQWLIPHFERALKTVKARKKAEPTPVLDGASAVTHIIDLLSLWETAEERYS